MTKADEELRSLKTRLANTKTFNYNVYFGQLSRSDNAISFDQALEEMAEFVATERKKAVQQFAAEVKGKAKTMIVETMSESRAANRKWIEAVSVTAIDEALESYES